MSTTTPDTLRPAPAAPTRQGLLSFEGRPQRRPVTLLEWCGIQPQADRDSDRDRVAEEGGRDDLSV